jgi:hypothetical protein
VGNKLPKARECDSRGLFLLREAVVSVVSDDDLASMPAMLLLRSCCAEPLV